MSGLWYIVAGAAGGVGWHYTERLLGKWGLHNDKVIERVVATLEHHRLLKLQTLVNQEIEKRGER